MNEGKITLDGKKFEESCSRVEDKYNMVGLAGTMYSGFGFDSMADYLKELGLEVEIINEEDVG